MVALGTTQRQYVFCFFSEKRSSCFYVVLLAVPIFLPTFFSRYLFSNKHRQKVNAFYIFFARLASILSHHPANKAEEKRNTDSR